VSGALEVSLECLVAPAGAPPDDAAGATADALLGDAGAFNAVLECVSSPNIFLKLVTVQTLSALIAARGAAAPAALLRAPGGVARLVELLETPEPALLNEVLLLLSRLSSASAEARPVLAFEDGVERLAALAGGQLRAACAAAGAAAEAEGGDEAERAAREAAAIPDVDSVLVAADCLQVISTCVRGVPLAQRLLAQGSTRGGALGHLVPVLDLPERLADAAAATPGAVVPAPLVRAVRLAVSLAVDIVGELVGAPHMLTAAGNTGGGGATTSDKATPLPAADAVAALLAAHGETPQLVAAQRAVGAAPGLLASLAAVALAPAPRSGGGALDVELTSAALRTLAAATAGHASNQAMVAALLDVREDAAAPRGSGSLHVELSLTRAASLLAAPPAAGEPALFRNAALAALIAAVAGSDSSRALFIGHAFAPPPVSVPT
jgi:hypothetical protein